MSRPDLYQLAAPIVSDVLDLNPSERERAITARCGDDDELAAEVRSLVSMDSHLNTEHPLGDQRINQERRNLERALDAPLNTKSHIGKYKIVREIGRGGMSVVYECEQEQPKRRVAVKLIDARLAGQSLNHRLRLEAEILGRLQHDSIAQVYEAGITDKQSGSRPFFAMELIDGVPLTKFADQNNLSTRARLELLARVADGVEHAHQKGVIHRDLKPGNILVTADGTPKILDFGIARIADSEPKTSTMHTSAGAILGTLSYMSPEQATGNSALLDTRSDIYSLGVLGFELLAGQLPHELQDKPVHDAVRIICEEPPTILSSNDRSLRGDVETIIGKALETEVDRRYASAAAFAEDIRRFLANEPIMARPPSTLYQVQKFARRNRALVGGTIATLLVLVIGVVVSASLAVSERHQRRLADERELVARQNNVRASFGLLSGAQHFVDAGDPWAAAALLDAIPRSDRGWTWRHMSLRTPWLIAPNLGAHKSPDQQVRVRQLVNDSEMLAYTNQGMVGLFDVTTEQLRTIIEPSARSPGINKQMAWRNMPANSAWFVDDDGKLQLFDTAQGTLETLTINWQETDAPFEFYITMAGDRSMLALHRYDDSTMRFYDPTGELFRIESGLTTKGMQWSSAHFLTSRPYIIAIRWSGEVRMIDRRTQQEVRRKQFPSGNHMGIGVLPDESAMYVSTNSGIELRSIPEMELLGTYATEYGPSAQLVISTDGRYVATNFYEEQLIRIFETET